MSKIEISWRTVTHEYHRTTIDTDDYPNAAAVLEGDDEEHDPIGWLAQFESTAETLLEVGVDDRDNINYSKEPA